MNPTLHRRRFLGSSVALGAGWLTPTPSSARDPETKTTQIEPNGFFYARQTKSSLVVNYTRGKAILLHGAQSHRSRKPAIPREH